MSEQFKIDNELLSLVDGWPGEFIFKYFSRIKIFGKENIPIGGGLLAPNHPSILDPPLLFLSTYKSIGRQIRYVAWAGLLEKKGYGDILRKANVIPVNPPGATGSEEIKKAYPISKTNKMVNESLRNNELVGVFPEGTNHLFWDGNTLYPIQKGILLWSAMSEKPIIPVGIRNSHLIWPMLANIDLQKINFQSWIMAPLILPVTIEIHYGNPIYVTREDLKDEQRSKFKLSKIIISLKELGNLK